jgi:ribosomal protein S20
VAAIQAGIANARGAPGGGTQVAQNSPYGPILRSAPPPGFDERLKQDQTAYASDQNNVGNRVINVQNLTTALDALKLTNMGRSTGAVHNFYSFLASQGIAPSFVDNDVTQYDIARKAMMAFAASRAGGTAGTDLARVQAELSNASPEIAQAASEHVLKQNLAMENMEIAATRLQGDKSGAGWGENKAKFYQDNDPRAFNWDYLDPTERADIQAKAAKTEGGLDKLRASLRNAIKAGVVHVPQQQSQAGRPGSNGPPAATPPPANALAAANTAGPANALAAA